MIEMIGAALKLLVLLFSEFFAWRHEQEAKNQKWVFDQTVFNTLAAKALDKMRDDSKKDSDDARDVEDKIDN